MYTNYYVVENWNLWRVVPSCRGVLAVVYDLEPWTVGRPDPSWAVATQKKKLRLESRLGQ